MAYFVALIIVIFLGGALLMRKRRSQRHYDYAPKPQPSNSNIVNFNQIQVEPVATPGFATEDIIQRETHSDVADDLLDPRNPGHAEWVKHHPAMESDEEWLADHPETPGAVTT